MSKPKKNKKSAAKSKSPQYVIKSGVNIGHLDAESDHDFLDHAFVEKNELNILKRVSDPHCVLVGRTGSGKTAFLNSIQSDPSIKIIPIQPELMSLKYLSNSDILNYFEKLNIKLDLFYKVLWKHVFVIELLKMYSGRDVNKFSTILDNIFSGNFFSRGPKQIVNDYLEKWKDSFWQNSEVKIKEMESNVLKKLSEAFKISPAKLNLFELSSSYESQTSQNIKAEILNKSQSVVNSIQMEDITQVINAMKYNLFDEKKGQFFIVIDDLDKEWVDKKIVYDLIRSMIEAIKDLNTISGVKIIIAIRENLLRLVFNTRNRGFQKEKYDSMLLNITWNEKELGELIDRRIGYLFKEKYTTSSPKVEDIFKLHSSGSNVAFQYMLERSFMRPRDIINFVNICIKNGSGKAEITGQMIKDSEREYSKARLEAIIDEWVENFPLIRDTVSMLSNLNETFTYREVRPKAEAIFEQHFYQEAQLEIDVDDRTSGLIKDYRETTEVDRLLKDCLANFFEMGIIGIKPSPNDPVEFSFSNNSSVFNEAIINDETKFAIHKMFHRTLNTTPSRNH